MKTALIVLDATPTFMPGGELPVPEGGRIVEPILRLMREGSFDETGDVHERIRAAT
jgi:nicotinamidase-related amidase